jgi:hypothetical protein
MMVGSSLASIAMSRIFSSFTKNGRYLIIFLDNGNFNSKIGEDIFGRAMITS